MKDLLEELLEQLEQDDSDESELQNVNIESLFPEIKVRELSEKEAEKILKKKRKGSKSKCRYCGGKTKCGRTTSFLIDVNTKECHGKFCCISHAFNYAIEALRDEVWEKYMKDEVKIIPIIDLDEELYKMLREQRFIISELKRFKKKKGEEEDAN